MKKTGIKYALTLSMASMLVLCGKVQANAQDIVYDESDEILQEGGFISGKAVNTDGEEIGYGRMSSIKYMTSAQDSVRETSVKDKIYEGLSKTEERIDVRGYDLKTEDLKTVYSDVLNSNGDLFYVKGQWSYSTSGGNVTYIMPSYTMSGEALSSAKAEFHAKADEILEQVNPDWSNLEKALFFNDYICTHYEYDFNYSIYDAYNMLTQGKGVCQAYTILYNYLLKQEGIQGSFATSDSMNHTWNIININGNWYHVDVTWNDPTPDAVGRSQHNNFLRSDEGIASDSAGGHHDWTYEYQCTSTTYENVFWKDIDAPFAYENEQWYCVRNAGGAGLNVINKCDINLLSLGESVYSFKDMWTAGGNSYWSGTYSGLGSYDGKLYFNTPSSIYSYDTNTKEAKEVLKPTLPSGNYLYGLYLDKNIIKYSAASTPNDKREKSGEYVLPEKTIPQLDISVVTSAATGNLLCSGGVVTPSKLRQHFGSSVSVYKGNNSLTGSDKVGTGSTVTVGNNTYTIVVKGDVSGDGEINVSDMEAIQKYVLKLSTVSGAYMEAGKLNTIMTNDLNVLDMEVIQRHILGLSLIK